VPIAASSGARQLHAVLAWLLVAMIATSLAWWSWRLLPLFMPRPASAVRDQAAEPSASRMQGWFSGSGAVKASGGRYTLRWLYPGRPGVCILALPGLQDKTFRIGEEIEPGVKLKEVGADFVVIDNHGQDERIALPEKREAELSLIRSLLPPGRTPAAAAPANERPMPAKN
jgi:general secretion pathway protein C